MNALLLVDLQNDFLPGGPLEVPHGDEVIPVANRLMDLFDLVVATQDWHPPDHASFAANHAGAGVGVGDVIEVDGLEQILWPVHCVQDTPGAELAADLDTGRIDAVFRKGVDPQIDSYSGFFDNGRRRATGLGDDLKKRRVTCVHVMGLATEYCVKFTALDAVSLGFDTVLVENGCRGLERREGDIERALEEMQAAGVRVTTGMRL